MIKIEAKRIPFFFFIFIVVLIIRSSNIFVCGCRKCNVSNMAGAKPANKQRNETKDAIATHYTKPKV